MGASVIVKSNPQQYPRWITLPSGDKAIVQNHIHHSALAGIEYDADAQPVQKRLPPTIEEVLAAGYTQEGAERIVAAEQLKADQGYPAQTGIQEAQPEPQHEDEEDLAAMFKKKE